MSLKHIIHSEDAPKAIGTYSQAIQVNNLVFLSGQIPLIPETMMLVEGNIEMQIHQVFKNLAAVIKAAGGCFSDVVKLNIYLIDLNDFAILNEIMQEYFGDHRPARATLGVNALPKGSLVEIDGILVL
jgi:reactive intermediate/imine deaminase